ncbi:hypothetical protein RclHR1_07840009 [Rhizophagus clarus]|uniref:Uncharacterized protein n=1 Tax=Rhizophagus clarus TaxID=94130 RepID=A0A2Z6RYK7_9GLOM|nr:hypothetical protein RclHR1_07840009 [Rhizophagus clarus]
MYRDDEVANQLPDNLSKNAIENRVEDRVMISKNFIEILPIFLVTFAAYDDTVLVKGLLYFNRLLACNIKS